MKNKVFTSNNDLTNHTFFIGSTRTANSAIETMKPNKKENKMINAKKLYWETSEDSEFYVLYDALREILDRDAKTEEVESLFYMLDDYVFGLGIQWGFSDTEVREHIYKFTKENKEEILANFQQILKTE